MKTMPRVLFQGVALLLFWLPGSVAVSAQTDASEWDEAEETRPHFLDPQKVAVLGVEVDGLVAQIHCQPQYFVRKGDVLLQLDDSLVKLKVESIQTEIELNTDANEALVSLAYAKDNLDIVEQLYEQNIAGARVGSPKEMKEAQQRQELALLALQKARMYQKLRQINLRQNQALRAKHQVRAPMDGVIVPLSAVRGYEELLKKVAVGEMVRAGEPVMALMKVDYLKVSRIMMDVSQLHSVRLGQRALVYVQGAPDVAFPGTVVFKSPTLTPHGQFDIEVEFANPVVPGILAPGAYRYRFRPNMKARIELLPDDQPPPALRGVGGQTRPNQPLPADPNATGPAD